MSTLCFSQAHRATVQALLRWGYQISQMAFNQEMVQGIIDAEKEREEKAKAEEELQKGGQEGA